MSPLDPAASPLVTVAELVDLLAHPGTAVPVLLDVRYPGVGSDRDGHAEYREGHVPGAAYLDLDAVLAGPHLPGETGRHPLPSPDVLQAGLRAAGVSDDSPVVVYDDWLSIAASRAWWLLGWAGHRDVRVLDGGWQAWVDADGPVETGERSHAPGDITVHPGGRRVIGADEAARVGESGVLVDARPANRFRGEDETIDPVAGHIPGAVSLPALSLVDDGRFLPVPELRSRFAEAGVEDGAVVGVYCGSGIQACHVALAAEAAGVVSDPALYAGSWSDWITDADRPVATG